MKGNSLLGLCLTKNLTLKIKGHTVSVVDLQGLLSQSTKTVSDSCIKVKKSSIKES